MKLPTLKITRLLPVVALVLGLAGANLATAGQFGVTTISPSNQTVSVGDIFSVDLTFQPGTLGTNGLRTPIYFDTSVLTYLSGSSTFGATIDTTNAATGHIGFFLHPTGFSGGVNTLGTFSFLASGPGTSAIDINPEQYLTLNNYGWFGINGPAVDGSVTVTGSAPAVPDTASTLTLLGGIMVGFAALRRRLA